MFDDALLLAAENVLAAARLGRVMVATAESCTGGLIAGALTAIPGSSDVFDRGFVTYTNRAKQEMLGLPPSLLASEGAVSEAAARAMAEGALARSAASFAIAVTGVAGPGGGSAQKPVGLVWFGLAGRGRTTSAERQIFPGDRAAVRRATVERALALLAVALRGPPA
ncbi:MAG: CinA family protein [Rhodospirillales bacterium]|nr:CinA family protein [Rhodospirillales bacterium]